MRCLRHWRSLAAVIACVIATAMPASVLVQMRLSALAPVDAHDGRSDLLPPEHAKVQRHAQVDAGRRLGAGDLHWGPALAAFAPSVDVLSSDLMAVAATTRMAEAPLPQHDPPRLRAPPSV